MRLLEREHILDALTEYAREASAGEGRLVLVSGEAGVGKSSLLDQFHTDCPGVRWVTSACDGLFTPRALAPLFEMAEQLGGEVLDACRREAPRGELFTTLVRQLSTSSGLTVLCAEDLHWADESTLDLLRFVARRIRRLSVLLVITYRDDALAADHALRIVLGELATERGTRRVAVPPLTEGAVATLAAGTGIAPDELHRLTGGNPFFVTEVVQAGATGVPASARDAVLSRVARLSSGGREAIEISALVGTRIEPSLLDNGGVSSRDLDELVTSGLLRSDGGSLRFRHEITRLAVEGEIPAHRRAAIHTRLLNALRAAGVEDDARLAFHAEGAADGDAVLLFAPSAGERASGLGAHREAAAQYERALRFARADDPLLVARLADSLAAEAALIDRFPLAAESGARALEIWRAVGNKLREGDTLRALSRTMRRLCRGDESLNYGNEALSTLEPLGPTAELARAYVLLAASHMQREQHQQAIGMAHKAAALAERLGLPAVISDALNTEACVLFSTGKDWQPLMRRALHIALGAGATEQAGRAYANMHELLFTRRRWAEAEEYLAEGVVYCDEHDMATFGTCLRGGHCEPLFHLGRWAESLALCRRLLSSVDSPVNRSRPLVIAARILAHRGDATAWTYLDEAVVNAFSSQDTTWVVRSLVARVEANWIGGDVDAATRDMEVAVTEADHLDDEYREMLAAWQRRLGLAVTVESDAVGEAAPAVPGARAAVWDERDCPVEAAYALFDSGTKDGLREALQRFEALGAVATANLVRRELRRIGVRSVPSGAQRTTREHPAGLTRREHEVLELICSGRTNGEISDLLVISPKTVDHHVSSVLAKLGVPSRRAAAAKAERLGLLGAGQR